MTNRKTFLTCAIIACAALPSPGQADDSNKVFFAIAGVSKFQFTETAHSAEPEKKYRGTTSSVVDPGAKAVIVVHANHAKSKNIANWFKTQVGSGQTLVCDSKGTFPEKLNFAVKGTLKMTIGDKNITCQDILVAQGHFGTTNNWWMGGPNMQGAHVSLSGATIQTCKVEGKILPMEVVFSPQTPCVNNFSISVLELK